MIRAKISVELGLNTCMEQWKNLIVWDQAWILGGPLAPLFLSLWLCCHKRVADNGFCREWCIESLENKITFCTSQNSHRLQQSCSGFQELSYYISCMDNVSAICCSKPQFVACSASQFCETNVHVNVEKVWTNLSHVINASVGHRMIHNNSSCVSVIILVYYSTYTDSICPVFVQSKWHSSLQHIYWAICTGHC